MTENSSIACPEGTRCPFYEELSELRKDVERLKAQVRTDHLTALYNKAHMLLSLENEMERTRRSSQATTIMLIDADHFKSINDTFGHIVGDKVLKHLAQTIQQSIRKIDIPCRFGGEEFCVILPSTSSLVGHQVAERLREMVASSPYELDSGETLNISVSIGLCSYTSNSQLSLEKFLEKCDEQLYRAKKSGRNRVCMPEQDRLPQSTVSAEEKDALFKP